MTEADWHTCTDLDQLLDFLLERKASTRKLRLFACACSVPLWPLVKLPACQAAHHAALKFADGLINEDALRSAWQAGVAAQPVFPGPNAPAVAAADPDLLRALARATQLTTDVLARLRSDAVMGRARAASAAGAPAESKAEAWGKFDSALEEARAEVRQELVFYLRCLFGDPSRPVRIDPAWLTWNDGTVVKMASTIYAEKRFADLPVLADALEEAGCTDDEILGHCRHDWEHFRGCRVLDRILGKE